MGHDDDLTAPAVRRYLRKTRDLVVRRALGLLSMDDEGEIAELLDDMWRDLSAEQQQQIEAAASVAELLVPVDEFSFVVEFTRGRKPLDLPRVVFPSATEGDDKDRFQKSVAKLVGEAAEGDWDVATEVVGAEAVAQLQALPAGWDSKKADDLLADMIEKIVGRELMGRITETTRKNIMGVLDSVG